MVFTSGLLLSYLDSSLGGILGLVVLVLQIGAIISILVGNGSTGHKLLWTVVILLLPLIGLILYAILGRSPKDRPLLE